MSAHRVVLVPNEHRDTVEAFAHALAEWDAYDERLNVERTRRLAEPER